MINNNEWTGNSYSNWVTLGATGHSNSIREDNDFYATPVRAVECLIQECGLDKNKHILEPSAGNGHISQVLIDNGFDVTSKDLIQRDYQLDGLWDFLDQSETWDGDIVMNPPYKYAQEFVEKALEMIPAGNKVYALLKIQFLESKSRQKLFKTKQLKCVHVFTSRIMCCIRGEFEKYKSSSPTCYAWFEFEKDYNKSPIIDWIN